MLFIFFVLWGWALGNTFVCHNTLEWLTRLPEFPPGSLSAPRLINACTSLDTLRQFLRAGSRRLPGLLVRTLSCLPCLTKLYPKKENTTLLGRIEVVLLWLNQLRLSFCPAKDYKGLLDLFCVMLLYHFLQCMSKAARIKYFLLIYFLLGRVGQKQTADCIPLSGRGSVGLVIRRTPLRGGKFPSA